MAGVLEIAVSDLIIQGHAVLGTASTNPGDINAQGVIRELLLLKKFLDGHCGFISKCNEI